MTTVRLATPADLEAIGACHLDAFGAHDGPEIVELVGLLLKDGAARPRLSLVAESEGQLVGHILFTAVRVHTSDREIEATILAPLGIRQALHGRGIGGLLIREGLKRLSGTGAELVFVLGHPGYYPSHGFQPAGALGLQAPHPIPAENADAWMVQALPPRELERLDGRVVCTSVLNEAKYWRE